VFFFSIVSVIPDKVIFRVCFSDSVNARPSSRLAVQFVHEGDREAHRKLGK
jgi:hypothetical protein